MNTAVIYDERGARVAAFPILGSETAPEVISRLAKGAKPRANVRIGPSGRVLYFGGNGLDRSMIVVSVDKP